MPVAKSVIDYQRRDRLTWYERLAASHLLTYALVAVIITSLLAIAYRVWEVKAIEAAVVEAGELGWQVTQQPPQATALAAVLGNVNVPTTYVADYLQTPPYVTSVRIQSLDATDVEKLSLLRRFGRLELLRIWGHEDRPELVRQLPKLSRLKELRLYNLDLSATKLNFLSRCPNLKQLTISNCLIEQNDLAGIGGVPMLEALSLQSRSDEAPLADTAISWLEQTPQLQRLDITATEVTGSGFEYLQNLPIEQLSVGPSFVDAGLPLLGNLDQLRSVHFGGSQLTTEGFAGFLSQVGLQELSVDNIRLQNAGAIAIGEEAGLETLLLSNTGMTDTGLEALSSLSHLHTLLLDEPSVTEIGFLKWDVPDKLTTVRLGYTPVSQAAIKAFAAAHLAINVRP